MFKEATGAEKVSKKKNKFKSYIIFLIHFLSAHLSLVRRGSLCSLFPGGLTMVKRINIF